MTALHPRPKVRGLTAVRIKINFLIYIIKKMENSMKKPTQKRVKECLKDIEKNFSELINAIIWYEQNDMDDWSYDIIGYIEKLPPEKEINLLINDFFNRNEKDFSIYSYQKLWWSLINAKLENINNIIKKSLNDSKDGKKLKLVFDSWYDNLDKDSDTRYNIMKIISKSNKMNI